MPRPTNKADLLKLAQENFDKLFSLIAQLSPAEQDGKFGFEDRDRNIRDVLVHLYEWHQLLLKWVNSNQAGKITPFLPEPYDWKTYPSMNVEFWQKHQTTPLEKSKKLLRVSHSEVINLINSFSDEQLFTKKYFPWTGTTSLGSYCISATSSHYDWAVKKVKRYIKELK